MRASPRSLCFVLKIAKCFSTGAVMFATAFALLYGNYHKLHKRFLQAIIERVPQNSVQVRLWLNTVCEDTRTWITKNQQPNWLVYDSKDENRPKYKVLRYVFHDEDYPIETPWVIWFDDDAIITDADWFERTQRFIQAHEPNVHFFGQQLRRGHQPGYKAFLKQARWYTGRAPQQLRDPGYRGPGITFVQGSYWWLKTDAMRQINWPDHRLSHNGGDTLLSEALWQQHIKQHDFHYGVAINSAPRRGLSESPAGERTAAKRSLDKPIRIGIISTNKRTSSGPVQPQGRWSEKMNPAPPQPIVVLPDDVSSAEMRHWPMNHTLGSPIEVGTTTIQEAPETPKPAKKTRVAGIRPPKRTLRSIMQERDQAAQRKRTNRRRR